MRIRSILPKFYESEDIGAMDWHTRLVFIGLWSYADDNGVGRDIPSLIAADLFPFDLSRDSRDTLARVSDALQTLSAGGQIIRYTLEKKPLYFIVKWDEYQRVDKPAKTRYERPTSTNAEIRETVATPSRDRRETVAPGEGEKGRRGEVTSSASAAEAREDVTELLDYLDSRIASNGAKRPGRNKINTDAMRLLLDADNRKPAQVRHVIEFATTDSFWKANILSAAKLREKFDQLLLKAGAATPAQYEPNSWMRSERKIPASWLEGEPVL